MKTAGGTEQFTLPFPAESLGAPCVLLPCHSQESWGKNTHSCVLGLGYLSVRHRVKHFGYVQTSITARRRRLLAEYSPSSTDLSNPICAAGLAGRELWRS